jgi:hypothetical protein
MNYEEINKSLVAVAEQRNRCAAAQDAKQREALEKECRLLEDIFLQKHGDSLREIMLDVQDEYFSDSDMLPLMSYLADHYPVVGKNEWGHEYTTSHLAGAALEIDDYPHKDTHMVIVPNPLRIVLNIDEYTSHLVWTAEKPTYVS